MPSYLIAIVVGALESRYGLSHLFADITMVNAASKLCSDWLTGRLGQGPESGLRRNLWIRQHLNSLRYVGQPSGFTGTRSRGKGTIKIQVSLGQDEPQQRMFVCQTETMLKTAEDLAGPYVWGQYDILVLPPSFPYGGMENPCLTFATPTLLVQTHLHWHIMTIRRLESSDQLLLCLQAGDKSLSNVSTTPLSLSHVTSFMLTCWSSFR